MFELEAAVSAWRRQIKVHGRTDGATIAELEDHLREEFARLVGEDRSPAAAWSSALERLGEPRALGREFAKVHRLPTLDRCVLGVLLALAGLNAAGAAMIFLRVLQRHAGDWTLAIHVAAICLGYGGGVVVALVAGYRTLRRVGRPALNPALTAVSMRIIRAGCVLVGVSCALGVTFGAAWTRERHGTFFGASLRELGGVLVTALFVASALRARRAAISPRSCCALAVLGGGIVLAAWLGPIAWESGYLVPAMIGGIGLIGSLAVAAVALSLRDEAPESAAI
jgi:hypothetical protein